jgi:uncharacterized metal-binding protein
MAESERAFSCMNCADFNCKTLTGRYPKSCLTTHIDEKQLTESIDAYCGDEADAKIARAAAEVEGQFYCQLTRLEEIIEFANKIGAKKIGIATCIGLIEESKIFARILRKRDFIPYGVACKVGATDKTTVGIDEQDKIRPGGHESLCNPIMQANILNEIKTDLNVMVGLCVGHDALFTKYADAPVTTLVTKDRVLGHNPVAALYLHKTYYGKLLK